MKNRHDLKAKEVTFNTGDSVWLYNPKRRKGLCPKLQSDWEGPHQSGEATFRLNLSDSDARTTKTKGRTCELPSALHHL